ARRPRARPARRGRRPAGHHARRAAAVARAGRGPVDPQRRPPAARADAEKKSARAAEQDRPDVAAARAAWRADQPSAAAGRPVFVGETHVNTQMHRRYARGPRGERVVGRVPHGHWKSMTVVSALTAGGLRATAVADGPMTAELFARWVEADLVPCLRPGGVVVLDNLPARKGRRVRELVEGAGCRLALLPPYSPDLNPIEMAFAKLKAALRRVAARAVPELIEWLGWLVHLFDPRECRNYIHHCGYDATGKPKPL
ncbi:MAG: IS630 family transposase, partial [Gemmataceae bacterium]|nr:IS630 family transposase [Gemmataceae bacterium]